MKRAQKTWIKDVLLLISICCCVSCERRDLYYGGDEKINYAEVALQADWTQSGLRPEDATVLLYKEGDSKPITFIMLQDYEVINLAEGNYSIIVFNQKMEDFSGIGFRDIDQYTTIQAFAKSKSSSSGRQVGTGQLVENPDLLAVASIDLFQVTPEMVQVTRTRVANTRSAATRVPTGVVRFEPKPCVISSKITVHIKNMYYIRDGAARVRLNGFAESIHLSSQKTTSRTAIQSFDFEKLEYEEGSTIDGYGTGSVTTFGFSTQPEGEPKASLTLTFEALLRDKEQTRVSFDRDVTDIATQDPTTEVNLVIEVGVDPGNDNPPIEIPPVEPENGGAFDPEVPDWGDEEVVDKEL